MVTQHERRKRNAQALMFGPSKFSYPEQGDCRLCLLSYEIPDLGEGDAVSLWSDLSIWGLDVSCSVAASKPTYHNIDGPGGKPYMSCDGVDDYLETVSNPIPLQLNTPHIFTVARVRSGAENGLAGYLQNYGSGRNGYLLGARSANFGYAMLAHATSYQEHINAVDMTQDVWYVAELQVTATQVLVKMNGNGNSFARTIDPITWAVGNRFMVGRRDNVGPANSAVDIAAVLVYNGTPTQADVITRQLMADFNIL